VGNVAERGPLATVGGPRQHSEKRFEIKVYPDVDFYILKPKIAGKQQSVKKLQNSQKTSKKRKKQQLTENQNSILNTEI